MNEEHANKDDIQGIPSLSDNVQMNASTASNILKTRLKYTAMNKKHANKQDNQGIPTIYDVHLNEEQSEGLKTRILCTAMSENKDTAGHNKRLLNTNNAAKAWGISRWTLYKLVKAGKISPIFGFGKGWKFQLSDWDEIDFPRL